MPKADLLSRRVKIARPLNMYLIWQYQDDRIEVVSIEEKQILKTIEFILNVGDLAKTEDDDSCVWASLRDSEVPEVPIVGDEYSLLRESAFKHLAIVLPPLIIDSDRRHVMSQAS